MQPVLRDYQQMAVDAIFSNNDHTVVSLPTGSGKSWVAAAVMARETKLGKKVLLATHIKELIEQDHRILRAYDDSVSSTIYSASLGRKDLSGAVVFGQIASLHRLNGEMPNFDVVVIDEVHRVGNNENSMYSQVLKRLPAARRIGLTATPYRLDSGLVYGESHAFFDTKCFEVSVRDLIPEYLSPVRGVSTLKRINTDGIHKRMGDFITSEVEQVACDAELIDKSCRELIAESTDRKKVLVFCVSVEHAKLCSEALKSHGQTSDYVSGAMTIEQRDSVIESFRNGKIKYLTNVELMTTGIDIPPIDCIVMLRPTLSKGLYCQQVGRSLRKAEGKEDAVLLDFSGNILRHGSIDTLLDHIDRREEARERRYREAAEAEEKRERNKRALPTLSLDTESDPLEDTTYIDFHVKSMDYQVVTSKKYPGKKNIMVTYLCDKGVKVRKWLCPEYTTGARWYAKQYLRVRGILQEPRDSWELINILEKYQKIPDTITCRKKGPYFEVAIEHFEEPWQN